MFRVLVGTILAIGGVFLTLTLAIVSNKAWRETRDGWRRSRRRILEPKILTWVHGQAASVLSAIGGAPSRLARQAVEETLLDHVRRVRGVERDRLGKALDELGYVDRWIRGLGSRRWWKRAESAERLGEAGAGRASQRLAALLDDAVPEVRIRAAKALGAVGGKAAVPRLIEALRAPDRWSTIRIADILVEMKQEAVEGLLGTYPHLNAPGKLAVLDILGRIRPLDALAFLAECLRDGDADVRARAAHALGAIGHPDSGPALVPVLRDAAWPARAMAAKALGRIRHEPSIPELCGALRDREWWVRANAAEALRALGEKGIEALEKMLDDRDVYARHQAVLMLQQSGILDREVARLSGAPGPERDTAESLVRRFVRAGQIGRLRELEETHADSRVRETLTAILGPASDPAETRR